MKNALRLLLTIFVAQSAFADNAGYESAINIGTGMSILGAARNDTLSAAAATQRNAYGFLAPQSGTIDQICWKVYSVTGTPGASGGNTAIFSDSNGAPNASLSNATFDVSATGLKCATMSQAVTAGTQYWFQVTNVAGTPASNFFGIWQAPEGLVDHGGGMNGSPGIGSSMCRSTDNGVTWTALNRNASAAYRVHYAAGTYWGFPAVDDDTPNNPIATADRIFGTAEVGNKFTTPANTSLNLRCVRFRIAKAAGTPTGFVRYRLYSGTTLVDTTASAGSVGMLTNPGGLKLCFSAADTLAANTTYRVVIGETAQADANTNAYGPHRIDWDSTASSLALKPFNGTLSKTTCASSCSGGTWTDNANSWYEMDLLLDAGAEFPTVSGSSPYSRGMTGNTQ